MPGKVHTAGPVPSRGTFNRDQIGVPSSWQSISTPVSNFAYVPQHLWPCQPLGDPTSQHCPDCRLVATQAYTPKSWSCPVHQCLHHATRVQRCPRPLKIYAENGKVEYQFSKTTDEFRGVTTSTLLDCSSKPVLALQSEHDVCKQRTTYHQADLPGCPASQRRQIEVYPNGPLTDVWRVNYVDADDHRHNFKFDREFASKDGNIYTQVRGKDGEMVAMLKSERRSDLWLTAGTNADDAATYTLFCTDAAPKLDLIALMGSVFTRVHDCGL
ncbi:hypothetical protein KEM48_011003 [Puccinia striiformis f. sp. tritici PST-130]|nr:hypothetical protein KEM48_011003 [Puccinia striiformis f. sp. tritici PST-130]